VKSRAGKIAAVLVVLGLIGYTIWMWYGQDYRLRFTPEELPLEAAVTTAPDGRVRLTVRLRNRCKVAVLVGDNPELGPPFAVELVNTDSCKTVPRCDAREDKLRPIARSVAVSGQHSITVDLTKLFGTLPAGHYELKAVYDTSEPAGRGESWAEDLAVGRSESPPTTFAVKATSVR
jgi:hypothetical protein